MLIAYKQINNTYIVFFILFTPRPFIRFCLLIVDIHSFGNELTDIFVVPQQFPYSSRADASQLRFGKEQNGRSEEHTSELQSRQYLVCRLLLEKKKSIRDF